MELLDAVNDYILAYTDAVQERLFKGYGNRVTLPPDNDYTIFFEEEAERIGTNVTEFTSQQTVVEKTLFERTVNIDFCGMDAAKVRRRAEALAILGRSYLSCDFFKKLGFNYNYADDMQFLPFTDEDQQYVHRYRIVLHVTEWASVALPQDNTETVTIRVVDVDAAYPPQE